MTHVEVRDQKAESRLRNEVRRNFRQIEGKIDWFSGYMPPQVFLNMVERIKAPNDPHNSLGLESFSAADQILGSVVYHLEEKDIPIMGLVFDQSEGGLEWVEHVGLKIYDDVPWMEFSIPTFEGKMVLFLCASEGLTLEELADMVGYDLHPNRELYFKGELARDLLRRNSIKILGSYPFDSSSQQNSRSPEPTASHEPCPSNSTSD